ERVIPVTGQNGGVDKTTTSATGLAASLAPVGVKTVLIGSDSQSNANNGTAAKPPQWLVAPSVNVFAVYGAEPEVQAYAMAKYSRSALSMKVSLKEISEQKAEQFLNTFYFQY